MTNTKNIDDLNNTHWGVEAFDLLTGGIPKNDIAVIETPDYHSGQVILGQYLNYGLQKGERCVLITFDTANSFFENFLDWNYNFRQYLDSEQFVLLNYKGNIANEVGLTYAYDSLFEEINRLSGGQLPARVAIQQVDTLINLNNMILMNQSAQKLAVAANQPHTAEMTLLGHFVQFNDPIHRDLSIALQKTVPGYFSLEKVHPGSAYDYTFTTKKLPWFNYTHHSVDLKLVEGLGFVNQEGQREVA